MKKLLFTIAILISAFTSHAWVIQYASPTYATHPNCADGSIMVQVWGTSTDIFRFRVAGPNGTFHECKAPDNFGSSYFTHTFNGLYPGAWHVEVWLAGPLCAYNLPGQYSDVWCNVGYNNTCTPPHIVSQTPATANCNGSITFSDGQVISNLPAGPYTHNGLYNCGCSPLGFSVSTTIDYMPCAINYTPAVTPSDFGCNNGSVSFTLSQAPYFNYYDVTIDGVNSNYWVGHTNQTNAYQIFDNLPPGDYEIGVYEHTTLGQNCYCTSLTTVTVPENVCDSVTIVSQTPAVGNCGGSVTLSNGEAFYYLPAGPFSYNVSYTCGCDTIAYTLNTTITTETCFTVNVNSYDMTAPPTYGCSSGKLRFDMDSVHNYNISISGPSNTFASFYGQSYMFENLPSGAYFISIRNMDLFNPECCLTILYDTIGFTPCATAFTPVVTPSDKHCNNGKIEFTITQTVDVAYFDVTIDAVNSNYWNIHGGTTDFNQLFDNLAPGDYELGVYEHRIGGIQCYCFASIIVTVPENGCDSVTIVSITPEDECGPAKVVLSNGDVFTSLMPGAQTLTGTFQCGCGIEGYSIDVVVPNNNCSFDVTAQVNYLDSCNANISGMVTNTDCGAIVMLWKQNQTDPDPLQEIGVGANGTFSFQNLTNGNYYVQIKSWYSDFYCNTGTGMLNISGINCIAPQTDTAFNIANNKVRLKWDTLPCAEGYIIRYKPVGSTKYKQKELFTNTNKTNLDGLISNTAYEWSIKTKCTTGKKSEFGATATFCNGICGARQTAMADENLSNAISIYPNPASNQINIELVNYAEDASNSEQTPTTFTLTVYDVLGKIHLTQNTYTTTLDISTLTPGLYVLRLQHGDNMYAGRFVKE